MVESALHPFFFSSQFFDEVILKRIPKEHSTCDWINGLLVHFLYVLNIGAQWNLVSWFDHTNRWQNELRSHLLDDSGGPTLHRRLKSCLVPILNLTNIVKELRHHRQVLHINVLLSNMTHQLLSKEVSCEWLVDEGSWLFLVKVKQLLSSLDSVLSCEVSIRFNDWSGISVLLLVLPVGSLAAVPVSEAVVSSVHGDGTIGLDILSKSKFDDSVSCEFFTRFYKHLTGSAIAFDVLEEGIISQFHA